MTRILTLVSGPLLAGLLLVGCASETDAPNMESNQQEIRNGTPSLAPQLDTIVSITNGSLGFGSGSLVAGNWVLTAGHVVDHVKTVTSNITVRWGNSADPAAQTRKAVAVYLHPSHVLGHSSQPAFPSDVDAALIRLETPFTNPITRTISSVSTNSLLNTSVSCLGYGKTVENDPNSIGTLTFGFFSITGVATNHVFIPQNNDLIFGSQVPLNGDSGGPCINLAQEVVGVISATDFSPSAFAYAAPAASFRSWAQGIMSNCNNQVPGSDSFCSAACPCTYGNADCDSDAECSTGNVCDTDVGAGFKRTPATDVCVSSACASGELGSSTYCSASCPCGHGGGDCDGSSQCQDGLTCATDIGPAFKMSPATDVCVPTACASRVLGSTTFCSAACPCGHGGGDCDGNSQCMPGLICVDNVGPGFGMGPDHDVCLPSACAAGTLGSSTYCSTTCPCGVGGGDCDSDNQCMPGLVCGTDNGPAFGFSSTTDVCVKP